jgi:hypothetical protein
MRTKGSQQLQVINTTVPNSYNVPIIATTIEEFYQYRKDTGDTKYCCRSGGCSDRLIIIFRSLCELSL